MVKVRQDAWLKENDELLAEAVLRHVKEGSTQLMHLKKQEISLIELLQPVVSVGMRLFVNAMKKNWQKRKKKEKRE